MAEIVWGDPTKRFYENGIDRGVFYPIEGEGVPWDGLISFDRAMGGNAPTSVYFDGVKINDHPGPREFAGVLKAYTFPDEFMDVDGYAEVAPGFDLGEQIPGLFHMSFRSMLNDGENYKIHVLYNLTATPSNVVNSTLSSQVTPAEFSWNLIGIPQEVPGFRPTCFATFDSRRLSKARLAKIEDILYGKSQPARLPRLADLIQTVQSV